jgi:AcrR family transcriptional regulator
VAEGEPPAGGAEPDRFEPDAIAELPAELALSKLPVGRHGLPRAFVARNQRLRMIAAMLHMLPEHSYVGTTIGHLTREAGVSRAAFYAQFSGKEDCFLATYDLAGEWLRERVAAAAAPAAEWPTRVRAGVNEALRLLAANPALAHLIAVDALQAGQAARERQRACLTRFAEALRAGRADQTDLPLELEEMLLGGALATIGRYVDSGRSERLADAGDELLQYLLIPYLGPGETRRIVAEAA